MAKPLDDIDQAIIVCLQIDSRTPSAEIARRVGVAERTVRARIDRLVGEGIIKLAAILNPQALGYSVAADVFLEVELGQVHAVAEAVADFPEVSYVGLTTGDRDISLQLFAPSVDALYEFVMHKLNRIPGVIHAQTFVIPRIVKSLESWSPSIDTPGRWTVETAASWRPREAAGTERQRSRVAPRSKRASQTVSPTTVN